VRRQKSESSDPAPRHTFFPVPIAECHRKRCRRGSWCYSKPQICLTPTSTYSLPLSLPIIVTSATPAARNWGKKRSEKVSFCREASDYARRLAVRGDGLSVGSLRQAHSSSPPVFARIAPKGHGNFRPVWACGVLSAGRATDLATLGIKRYLSWSNT
jgi:hypothetical protein